MWLEEMGNSVWLLHELYVVRYLQYLKENQGSMHIQSLLCTAHFSLTQGEARMR